MKKSVCASLILGGIFLFPPQSLSQQILYYYDATGNRVKREAAPISAPSSDRPQMIAKLAESRIIASPNPTTGYVSLSFSGVNGATEFHLFSLSGLYLGSHPIQDNQASLDLTFYPTGTYLIQTISHDAETGEKEIVTVRIIKE